MYPATLPLYGFSVLNVGERGVGRPDWIVGGALVVGCAAWVALGGLRPRRSEANLPVFLFAVTGVLSAASLWNAGGDQWVDYATKGIQLALVVAVLWAFALLPLTEDDLRRLIRVWVVTAFLVAVYGLYQLAARTFGWPLAYLEMTNPTIAQGGQTARTIFGYVQFSSVLREPSYLSSYLGGPLVFVGAVAAAKAGSFLWRRSGAAWLVTGVLALTIVLAGSQGSYASLAGVVLLALALGLAPRRRTLRIVLAAGLLVGVAAIVLQLFGVDFIQATLFRLGGLLTNIADPTGTAAVSSFANRFQRTMVALSVWSDYPLLGVGLGNMPYHTDQAVWANNAWAQLLVEQGLLGTGALLVVWGVFFAQMRRLATAEGVPAQWRAACAGLALVLLLDAIDALFTLNWTHPQRWFTLTMANALWLCLRGYLRAAEPAVAPVALAPAREGAAT